MTVSRMLGLVLLLLPVAGCGEDDPDRTLPSSASSAAKPAATRPLRPGEQRFLALGDSYTVGAGVEPNESWPSQLAARLRDAGHDVGEPEIIAQTSWRTQDLRRALGEANPEGPYGLVSLLVGVNNQFYGRGVDEYRAEFDALLRQAVALAGGEASRVLVLSIPHRDPTGPTGGNASTDPAALLVQFNAVNRELSERAGARYVDVGPSFRGAARDPGLLAEDGSHPSGRMYGQWADLALPEAEAALAAKAVVGADAMTQPVRPRDGHEVESDSPRSPRPPSE